MNTPPLPGYFSLDVSVIRVTGEKAAVFLNGQFTNDIKNLESGEANYNLFLTQKGKIVADLTVYRLKDDFLLLIPKPFASKVLEPLSRLAPLSRVMLADETTGYSCFHSLVIASPDVRRGEAIQMEHMDRHVADAPRDDGIPVHPFSINRLGPEGTDWIVQREQEDKFVAALGKEEVTELDFEAQEIIRIENGIGHVGIDATEENLPQEAGLMRAISLTKGCYLGQEVVARLHYRGHVNKILVGLKIEGKKPSVGVPIFSEGKEVGKITSAVFSPTLSAPLALGYVPYAKKDPGNKFQVGPSHLEATIIPLPLTSSPASP